MTVFGCAWFALCCVCMVVAGCDCGSVVLRLYGWICLCVFFSLSLCYMCACLCMFLCFCVFVWLWLFACDGVCFFVFERLCVFVFV